MDPRKVLQERYPKADFTIYFRHIDACLGTKRESGRTHEHHICPNRQFPEYGKGFPENLIVLSLEDHDFAHKLLETACAIKAPATMFMTGPRLHLTPEHQSAAGRKSAARTTFARLSAAGKIGGHKAVESGQWNSARKKGHAAKAERRRIFGSTPKEISNGRALGQKNIAALLQRNRENGHQARLNHIRWHVNRGLLKANCVLCVA
jgi:hypothetical protein